jgi:hypothetical protein
MSKSCRSVPAGGLCRLGLLDLSPALNSLLLETGHVELNQVTAVLVVVHTLGAVALLQFLLNNASLHGLDPGLANGKSTGTEDGYIIKYRIAMQKNKMIREITTWKMMGIVLIRPS